MNLVVTNDSKTDSIYYFIKENEWKPKEIMPREKVRIVSESQILVSNDIEETIKIEN